MAGDDHKRVAFETARLELARLRVDGAGHVPSLQGALRLCADAVRTERVGFWRFSDDHTRLVLVLGYCRSTAEWSGGELLSAHRFPAYWEAANSRRVIAADDALTHPATAELADGYLRPLGIGALLDAPVFRDGAVIGVICFEHVGPARAWTSDELSFASTAGDLIALQLEQADRLAAEAEARLKTGMRVSADQLELLDSLCRGLAHDFSNVLLAVELVGGKLARAGQPDLAERLRSCAEVGGNLVSQLRRFGARGTDDGPRLPVRAVIERLMPIVVTLVRDHAKVEVHLDELAADEVAAIPATHLEQIVLNLCLNARDAVGAGGTIAVRAYPTPRAIAVTIGDDGVGMTPEIAARVWERNFTTKPHGTGLGLATVRALVDEHGAAIEFTTAPGAGTTFTLTLPRA
ncbi:MAG: GAF domain-containing protein [Kofleriaceae bacterium]|jgi:signal transduction histidine kinase|nr:GAF domain-containing protein [Kofleriaceae bacterium]MBP9167155.1 GAF domain-containing protein [Kofleriaceae bacterium]MBP9861183.1 GAF domain-containing protein [Kofleriaceae bacterium]